MGARKKQIFTIIYFSLMRDLKLNVKIEYLPQKNTKIELKFERELQCEIFLKGIFFANARTFFW